MLLVLGPSKVKPVHVRTVLYKSQSFLFFISDDSAVHLVTPMFFHNGANDFQTVSVVVKY